MPSSLYFLISDQFIISLGTKQHGITKMEFSTPKAIHHIKINNHKNITFEGKHCSPLEAMSIVFNYHRIYITQTQYNLYVRGLVSVSSKIKRLTSS